MGEARLKALLHSLHSAMIQARRALDQDVEHRMRDLAAASSARYATEHMLTARPIRAPAGGSDALALLDVGLAAVTVDGFAAEFGVHTGGSIRHIAGCLPGTVHGFDSFEGLPEDWHLSFGRGRFGLGGRPPELGLENVRLWKGWFADTLPRFAQETPGPAAFLHIDCDLYSSTRTVLDVLGDRIVAGTVIVFDEYLNYPGWEQHEAKAWREFCQDRGVVYRYLAFAPAGNSVAVAVESVSR